jgi:antitoxin MazE
MRSIVKKWGNSAAVRVPAGIMETARFSLDMPVDVPGAGNIVWAK